MSGNKERLFSLAKKVAERSTTLISKAVVIIVVSALFPEFEALVNVNIFFLEDLYI